MLKENEVIYFQSLHKDYGITKIHFDEEGVGFDEYEFQKFISNEDNPQINLEKMLLLNKITKAIYERLRFNYEIFITTEKSETKVKIEFFE